MQFEDSFVLSVLASVRNMQMFCGWCKQDLPDIKFNMSARKRFYRGNIKFTRCSKCSLKARKQSFETAKGKLQRATSPKKIAKLKKRIEQLTYSLITRPRMMSAKRRAQELRARPPWVKNEWFAPIYDECRRKNEETGIKHHVDHIVPLQGRSVSGLDVPWNLRVITASENCRKSNKFGDELNVRQYGRPWGGQFD